MRFLQSSMNKLFLGLVFTGFGLIVSCSKENEAKEKEVEKSAAPAEELVSEKPVVALTSGIPEFCSLTERDDLTCMRCIPRDIPILKCANKKLVNLIPVENCTFDDKLVACTSLETEFDLRLEYTKHSTKEKYYLNLEEVIGGIKFVVGATFKHEGENDRVLLFAILDTVIKYKKDVFLGLNTEKVVDDLMAAFIAKDPELSEERRARVRANIKKAVELLADDIDENVKGSTGVIMFLSNILEAMKVGNEGSELGSIEISKLVEAMNSPKYKDMIDQLLSSYVSQ